MKTVRLFTFVSFHLLFGATIFAQSQQVPTFDKLLAQSLPTRISKVPGKQMLSPLFYQQE